RFMWEAVLKPLGYPAAESSFLASPMSCWKYFAFGPKSFPFGSSHQPSQLALTCEFHRVSTGRPSAANFETLKKVSSQRSRSHDIDTAWRTRSSRKGDLPSGSQ